MPLPVLSSRGVIKEVIAFQLNSRPVFRVKLMAGGSIVIKGESGNRTESDTQASIRLGGKLMQVATPGLKTEPLTPAEIAVLRGLNPVQLPGPVRIYLFDCLDRSVFYKMPFMEGIRDADDMFQNNKAGKLLGKLKGDDPAMRALGKIVAVDLFIGNSDRFTTNGHLQNESNLIFVKNADKSYTPVGLDFYEAMGMASNLLTPPPASAAVSRTKGLANIYWGGPLLMNQITRQLYASKCIASLNRVFQRELQKAGPVDPVSLLGTVDEAAFAAGLEEGTRELRQYLTNKAMAGKLPQGVLDRMSILNWTWSATAAPARPGMATPQAPGFTANGFFFEKR